jgi:hypothetical protein
MKRFVTLALGLTTLAMLLACGKKSNEPKPEPTPLFQKTVSYWSLEKAKHELGLTSWVTVEDRQPLVSDKRPPFRLLVIRVPDYRDHGYTGSLVLWFYNDRLMKTQFYVPNAKDYVNVAGVSVGNDLSGAISPHTRVWIGKEGDGRTYIGMEDEILKQQMDDWVVRYSG